MELGWERDGRTEVCARAGSPIASDPVDRGGRSSSPPQHAQGGVSALPVRSSSPSGAGNLRSRDARRARARARARAPCARRCAARRRHRPHRCLTLRLHQRPGRRGRRAGGHVLGGGRGFLARALGQACDRLRAVALVDAAGALLEADAERSADLLWASCRGGGGAFGVAVEFTLALVEVPPTVTVFNGTVRGAAAAAFLDAWQRWQGGADARVTTKVRARVGAATLRGLFYRGRRRARGAPRRGLAGRERRVPL